jgi:hypothetical protein
VSSSGGPPEQQSKQESTIDVKLLLNDKGYQLTMAGASIDIPKLNGAYDRKALGEKLKTLKTSLPDQSAITVQPEDSVAYSDLVETVDTAMGERLRNVTVAPAN